jgi:putative chitobiose transport system permease protein
VIDRPEFYTLPLGVATLAGQFSLDWRLVAAGSIISLSPVMILFGFLQRYIIPTDSGSGVKG